MAKDKFFDTTPDEQLVEIAEKARSDISVKEIAEMYKDIPSTDTGRKDTNRSTDLIDISVGDAIVNFLSIGYSISEAAKAVGLTPNIIYKMQEREPEFKLKCNQAQSTIYTRVLLRLLEAIDNGNIDATKFFLSHRYSEWMHPDKYLNVNINNTKEKETETVEFEIIVPGEESNENKDS